MNYTAGDQQVSNFKFIINKYKKNVLMIILEMKSSTWNDEVYRWNEQGMT